MKDTYVFDYINENPEKVLDMLRERLGVEMEKLIIKENKKKRH